MNETLILLAIAKAWFYLSSVVSDSVASHRSYYSEKIARSKLSSIFSQKPCPISNAGGGSLGKQSLALHNNTHANGLTSSRPFLIQHHWAYQVALKEPIEWTEPHHGSLHTVSPKGSFSTVIKALSSIMKHQDESLSKRWMVSHLGVPAHPHE